MDTNKIPNKTKRFQILLLPATFFVIIVILFIAGIYLSGERLTKNNLDYNILTEKNANERIYFGKGKQDKYVFIDIENGLLKELIPSGYTIVNQHGYSIFPSFLILQKEDRLFTYNIESKTLKDIFSFNNAISALKKTEILSLYPSITEKEKFFLTIDEYEQGAIAEMGRMPKPLNTRSYLLDASKELVITTENFVFDTVVTTENQYKILPECREYDSKNQRFFVWPCEEGIGSSLPLFVSSLNGKKHGEVISLKEFGLSERQVGSIDVEYKDGLFFAIDKKDINRTKIVMVDPETLEPAKEIYAIVNSAVKTQIPDGPPYSILIDKKTNTIIVGNYGSILLLRFNSHKEITQGMILMEKDTYFNFIFADNGKAYYQTKENIKILDLENWSVVKSIPSLPDEEITLFTLLK